MWRTFPLLLHLSERKCVVIGGGSVAGRRVRSLLEAQGDVTVVAPDVSAEIEVLRAAGAIRVVRAAYSPAVLEGAFLVVVATSDPALNAQICTDASGAGILVNDVDEPERGDCIFPAVVRRGDLVISVTTGGASPSMAAQIQHKLAAEFGPEYDDYVALLREVRDAVLKQVSEVRSRKRILTALSADTGILELIRAGKLDDARTKAYACISSSSD